MMICLSNRKVDLNLEVYEKQMMLRRRGHLMKRYIEQHVKNSIFLSFLHIKRLKSLIETVQTIFFK